MMFARGSPKYNLLQARNAQKKASPKGTTLGGQTTEGGMNFTSLELAQHVIFTQVDNVDDYVETENLFLDTHYDECNDMSSPRQHTLNAIQHELHQRQSNATSGENVVKKTNTNSRDKGENVVKKTNTNSRDKGEKAAKKRKQDGNVADMMGKYLEVRTKQVEEKAAELAKERVDARRVDDFSIKNCISVLNTMEDLSNEEKAKAFGVFKDDFHSCGTC